MDPTPLRERLAECDRALDCNSDGRNRNAARCRTAAQESPWRLRPRHQLVEGAGSVIKTTRDMCSKGPIQHRRSSSSTCKLAALRRALLPALLLSTSALAGCATYIPPEISYDAEVPPLAA